ncbi:MAG: DNA mismatch repair endonuclease MutL [Patescibacteria group bacterium]
MGIIKVLPQDIINQIAAGEVIERPSSVVKELVENSLDAGASTIEIEIKNGGLNLIKVIDNGSGMSGEDALLSVKQHATSKISLIDDLFRISSFGFRGEALASIASVSKFSLQTKDQDSISGNRITIYNQEVRSASVGCPQGTCVSVEDLFYNVPARKKYLKTVSTEFNHILELFTRFALIHGKVSWKLIHNGKTVFHLPSTPKWLERIELLLGERIAQNVFGLRINMLDVEFNGYLGKPQIASKSRANQFLYINKRPVNEHIISKSVKDAFQTLIPRDYYPVYLMNLRIDPFKLDVNVHPRKLEVRFSEPQTVYRSVYRAVSATLDKNNLVKTIYTPAPIEQAENQLEKTGFFDIKSALESKSRDLKMPSPGQIKRAVDFNHSMYALPKSARRLMPGDKITVSSAEPMAVKFQPVEFKQEKIELVREEDVWKIIGQIKNSYIIVETGEGLKIIDQHAASERVQFEKIISSWKTDKLRSQSLLLPVLIDMSSLEMAKIHKYQSQLNRLGFSIDVFGENTVKINAVPALLKNSDIQKLFFEVAAELDDRINNGELTEPIRKILNILSCRSAVKFGDDLTLDEMKSLIAQLRSLDNQYTCVHGRPAIIDMSYGELEKLFSRK